MALKTYKPTTPSQRQLVLVDKSFLYKGAPFKPLTKGLKKTGGRNNNGRITTRHIGGGHKRSYRVIDFKRSLVNHHFAVERIEYDPNRTAFIALIASSENSLDKRYIIAPDKLQVGAKIYNSNDASVSPGNAMQLHSIPVGTLIHNIELKEGKGAQLARSAGSYAQLAGKDNGYAQIKLSSGELRLVREECIATIGVVSNSDHSNVNYGKAGRKRWLGVKPTVRGVAMNPIDHPHGGGEGKTSGGRHPVTPWGKITKGKKTRNNKSTNRLILRSRHKNKRK